MCHKKKEDYICTSEVLAIAIALGIKHEIEVVHWPGTGEHQEFDFDIISHFPVLSGTWQLFTVQKLNRRYFKSKKPFILFFYWV